MTITCLIDDDDDDDDDGAGFSGDHHFCAHVPGNVANPIIKHTNF